MGLFVFLDLINGVAFKDLVDMGSHVLSATLNTGNPNIIRTDGHQVHAVV